jgi:hypothetical protein
MDEKFVLLFIGFGRCMTAAQSIATLGGVTWSAADTSESPSRLGWYHNAVTRG